MLQQRMLTSAHLQRLTPDETPIDRAMPTSGGPVLAAEKIARAEDLLLETFRSARPGGN
jgi:hypothetical protein